ncbi:MAG TPA: hypothetical protein PKC99_18680 [Anaerolineales bacterium]|nr:hypothetical protein [Anaerolineales bacterium]
MKQTILLTIPILFIISACSNPQPIPPTQPAELGSVALDFVALLCDAQWMNGTQQIIACPDPNTVSSTSGWATLKDPVAEGLPSNTPALLMFAGNNSPALFLRYPTIKVHWTDRFRATLRCQIDAPCDVQFALEYYDAQGKYHSPFYQWNYTTTYKTNSPAINVDVSLGPLAGQSVDFVLALRPQNGFLAQIDGGLWIAPVIYRPSP